MAWMPERRPIAAHLAVSGLTPVPATSTIWRILSRRGFVASQPQKRPRSSWRIFCADQPNERWQADITHWRLAAGAEVDILNILDDHSRICIASAARLSFTAGQVWQVFLAAIGRWGHPADVLTDIQAWWCPEVPGLSGWRCEGRGVRHPCIVVA